MDRDNEVIKERQSSPMLSSGFKSNELTKKKKISYNKKIWLEWNIIKIVLNLRIIEKQSSKKISLSNRPIDVQ